ncbi:MAG: AAA family ATPase [Bacillota bacterium]|nr:AAA family ATPase [Bacillota bacterium]
MERIKVFVVEDDPEKRSSIVDTLSNVEYIYVEGEASSSEEALEMVDQVNPNVMLIGAYVPGDGYKLAEKISSEYSWISIIIVEEELKEETMRKAIFVGAKDVLIYPFTPSKLVDSIYQSFQMEKKKQVVQKDKTSVIRQKSQQGKVITVFSTKGGVGKTFISTNLAVSLAQLKGEKVVLVDLDLDFGNVALSLNIIPRYTIIDVINDIRNLDQDLMKGYLVSHQSGIKVLAANVQPQKADFINAEHIEVIIKVLQSAFDYVVIDMPTRFYDPVVPAFQEADLLMLVTTPEVAAIRNIKACMVSLNGLNYPRQKIRLLLNKAEPRGDIKTKDVETTLDQTISGILPAEHKLVTSSLNKGVPVVLLYPRSKISRSFQNLVRRVVENGLGEKKQTSSVHKASS